MHNFLLVPAFLFSHEVDASGEIAVIVVAGVLLVANFVLVIDRNGMALAW